MPITLADLTRDLETCTVTLAGREAVARGLSVRDTMLINSLVPMPQPPLSRDPNRGSSAPLVPNPHDPEYKAQLQRWYIDQSLVMAAVSVDYRPEDGKSWDVVRDNVEMCNHWAGLVRRELEEILCEGELVSIRESIDRLNGFEVAEEAQGN